MIDIGGKKYLDETEVKELIKDFAKTKDVNSIETRVTNDISEKIKAELYQYELTKDVNAKIKSCRDTMGENYENHAKGVDSKVSALTSDISIFKKSQLLAHEKLKDDTEKSIKSESEKIEKSILKKVLDKISKLMG